LAVGDDVNESYAKAMAVTSSDTESLSVTGNHRKAYESSLPEILGLSKDEIQTVNTDVIMAVGNSRANPGTTRPGGGEVE
jgi:hypothetical protein